MRIDREYFKKNKVKFSLEKLNDILFQSACIRLGYMETTDFRKNNNS